MPIINKFVSEADPEKVMGVATLDIIKLNKQGGKTEKKEKRKKKQLYIICFFEMFTTSIN